MRRYVTQRSPNAYDAQAGVDVSPGPSQEDQRGSSGMLASCQCRERSPGGDRESTGQRRSGGACDRPVVVRVRHEEQEIPLPRVTLFERQPALQGLPVADVRLGLHGERGSLRPSKAGHPPIPRSKVARDGQRNLCAEPDLDVEARAQSIDQRPLPRVSEGISIRVGARSNVKSDDSADQCRLAMGSGRGQAAFDPRDLGRRHADSCPDHTQGQTCGHSRLTKVASDANEFRIDSTSGAMLGAIPGRHAGQHGGVRSPGT